MTSVEAYVSSLDGTVVLRDAGESAVADIRLAANEARRGGSQRGGGRVAGVAGGALLIRCADQYSSPTLLIHVHQSTPACVDDSSWTWLERATINVGSGHLVLDCGDAQQSGWDGDVLVGTPGRYTVLVGHRGRTEFRNAAGQVRVDTLNASVEAGEAAWQSLRGIEQYSIELWPGDDL